MINNTVLMGRLTADPELRSTPSGVSVVTITVAVDRGYVKKGEDRKSDFIKCSAWRQTAEFICRHFKKGSLIALQGSIQNNDFTDKDGKKRNDFIVVIKEVSFCGDRNNNRSDVSVPYQKPTSNDDFEEIIDDDELPFG